MISTIVFDDSRWILEVQLALLDHVGLVQSRRRDMGYHNIFDYYSRILKLTLVLVMIFNGISSMSTYKDAHRCAVFCELSELFVTPYH